MSVCSSLPSSPGREVKKKAGKAAGSMPRLLRLAWAAAYHMPRPWPGMPACLQEGSPPHYKCHYVNVNGI